MPERASKVINPMLAVTSLTVQNVLITYYHLHVWDVQLTS